MLNSPQPRHRLRSFVWLILPFALAGCVGRRAAEPEAPAKPGPILSAPKHAGGLQLAVSQEFLARSTDLIERGALAVAVESLSDALAADPENARIYYMRASVQLQRQRPMEAIQDLSMAIKVSAQPSYFLSRCGAYFVVGAWHQAISDCTDTIQMAPMEADAYLLRGLTYYTAGEIEKALADALVVLMIRPNDANAKRLVNEALEERERRQRGYATPPAIKTDLQGEGRG